MPNYSSICDVCLKSENFPSHIEDFSELKNLIINDAPSAVTYSRRVAVSQHVANIVEKYEAWGLAYLCGVEEVLDRLKIEEAIKHLEHLFSQIRLKPEVASSCSLY